MRPFGETLKKSLVFLCTIIFCIGVLFPIAWPAKTAKAATQTITMSVAKDKFVDDTGGHSYLIGFDDNELFVGKTSFNGISHAMMAFDLSSVPGKITSASLTFFICATGYSPYMDMYGSFLDSWTETNDVAATAGEPIVDDELVSLGYNTYDVSGFVQNQHEIDQMATFLFKVANESRNNDYSILSRESMAPPVLSITYEIPPSVDTNTGLTLNEGATEIITSSHLSSSDDEHGASTVTYTFSDMPDNGTLYKNSSALGLGSTFTQADINNNLITYTHNGSNTISDSFTFSVWDSAGSALRNQTFGITVNEVDDDAPTIVTNNGLEINEGSSDSLQTQLVATDTEDTDANLKFTVTDSPDNGTLSLATFTQAQLDTGSVTYTHNDSETTTDSFIFKVEDASGNELTGQTFSITINSIDDDAPTIALNNGLAVDEGASGSLQTQLVATDTEDTDGNLKFTVTDTPDNGTLNLATFTQAQLDAKSVTYTHNDSETTTDSFIFKVEDASGNELTGQTFSITINSIDDDAPTIALNNGLTVDEGASGSLQTQLIATDTEDTDANLTFTVTAAPINGTLSLVTFTQAQLDAGSVTYTHNDSETTTDSFIFKVEDTNGNKLTGQTFSITVSPINDAPPTPMQGSNTRTIKGKLVDSDGNPMAGCIVELHSDPITIITDEAGKFAFYNVEYTDHTLIIKKNSGLQLAAYVLEFAKGSAFDSAVSDTGVQITYTQNTVAVDISMSVSDEDDVAIDDVDSVSNPSTGSDGLSVWLIIAAALLAIVIGVLMLRRYVFC